MFFKGATGLYSDRILIKRNDITHKPAGHAEAFSEIPRFATAIPDSLPEIADGNELHIRPLVDAALRLFAHIILGLPVIKAAVFAMSKLVRKVFFFCCSV